MMDALPAELLFLIADKLDLLVDRLSFRAVFPGVFTLKDVLRPFPRSRRALLAKCLMGRSTPWGLGMCDDPSMLEDLEHRIGLTAEDVTGRALFLCAHYGYVALVECMHDRYGLTADRLREDNNYTMEVAVKRGHVAVLECLRRLFGLGVEDVPDFFLHVAAYKGHTAVLEWMRYRIGMDVKDRHDLLGSTLERNSVGAMLYVRDHFGVTTEDARANNNYFLYWVSFHGKTEALETLHDAYGLTAEDARTCDNIALRVAAEEGHVAVLECLHRCFGLGPEDARSKRNAAIRIAARCGHVAVVECLHRRFGLTTQDARTRRNKPLRHAAWAGSVAVLEYLREGFGLTREDARSCGAILSAAKGGHVGAVRCLCEQYGLDKADAMTSTIIRSATGGVVEYLLRWYDVPKKMRWRCLGANATPAKMADKRGHVYKLKSDDGEITIICGPSLRITRYGDPYRDIAAQLAQLAQAPPHPVALRSKL